MIANINYSLSTMMSSTLEKCNLACSKKTVTLVAKTTSLIGLGYLASQIPLVASCLPSFTSSITAAAVAGAAGMIGMTYLRQKGFTLIEQSEIFGTFIRAWGNPSSISMERGIYANNLLLVKWNVFWFGANATLKHYSSPLFLSCERGQDEISDFLIKQGADVTATDSIERTPLHYAACRDTDLSVIHALLENGANINAKDTHYATPLSLSCYHQKSSISLKLIQMGAEVDTKDRNDITPLHEACSHGDDPVIEALIKHGASAFRRDSNGKTPLYYAKTHNHPLNAELREQYRKCDQEGWVYSSSEDENF